jgi:hypothetical protein
MNLSMEDFKKPERFSKQLQCKVTPSDYAMIEEIAKDCGTTVSSVARLLIRKGLEDLS